MRAPFERYWDAVVEPLIADAGPLAGRTLKYLHTDSWEVEAAQLDAHAARGVPQAPRL